MDHLLTGPEAGELLSAALAVADAELLSWRAVQVDPQPGTGITVAYETKVRWRDRVTEEVLGAAIGAIPEGAFVLDNGRERVAVWRFPFDPWLPGLAAAADPAAVADLLARLGAGTGVARVRLRAYRPRRRAVLEVGNASGRVFLKVVPTKKVKALHERHRIVAGAGFPAPQSLGFTEHGVVVLQSLAGHSLREEIRSGPGRLPGPDELTRLLDRLPAALTGFGLRPTWTQRAAHYAAVVATCLPAVAGRVRRLADALAAQHDEPIVPVHGDFYEAQVYLRQGAIGGLLDLDTAGGGQRADDLACLLGHLAVLELIDPARAGRIARLRERYLAGFERDVNPRELRRRVAAVVLSLATGPHRVQEPHWERATEKRLELAEHWMSVR